MPASIEKEPSAIARSSSYIGGSHILESHLHYRGFLEQLKQEGLKGKLKLWIFKVIGFFAWWQGQVNTALYQALVKQSETLGRQESQLAGQQALLVSQNEHIVKQEAQLAKQEAQLAKQEAQLAKQALLVSQNEHIAKQEATTGDRDKVIEDIYQKLSLSSKFEDAFYEELTLQRAEMVRHCRYIGIDNAK